MQHNNVVIANGAALSDAVDLWQQTLGGIIMPSAWTAAGLSFQGHDGQGINEAGGGAGEPPTGSSGWKDIYDADGTELVALADASRFITIAPDAFRPVRWLRVRSGTTGTPVNQGAARTLGLVLLTDTGS